MSRSSVRDLSDSAHGGPTVTSHRVGCGCTIWSFTTLGGCGLSLSLGLLPMKTHSSKREMRSNYCVLAKARRGGGGGGGGGGGR